MAVALALGACSGFTTAASNLTPTSAQLNAHVACSGGNSNSGGTPCQGYFEWATVASGGYTNTSPVQGPVNSNFTNEINYTVSGLSPGTAYQYKFCGEGDGVSSYVCVGMPTNPGDQTGGSTPSSFTTPTTSGGNAIETTNYRYSAGTIEAQSGPNESNYNYAPSIMQDGSYRMWWCGSGPPLGDAILYATSSSLDSQFSAPGGSAPYQTVFRATGGNTFDSVHTCDPSVVRANGIYYMYYGGWNNQSSSPTEIGVASSLDGVNWTRMNNGNPIVVPADKTTTTGYGAGQPSVIFLNNYFYMLYIDTTGAQSYGGNVDYVLRSTDPTFQTNVDELTSTGFAPETTANHTSHALLLGPASVDWTYSDALQAFVVAYSGNTTGGTTLRFFSPNLLSQPYPDVTVPGGWSEGPGIVRRPDGHAVPPVNSQCGTVPLNLVHSTTFHQAGAPDMLAHVGVDLTSSLTCSSMASRMGAVYEGYAIQVPNFPLTLVVNGERLQAGSVSPVQDLTRNFIAADSEVFYDVPFGASLPVGASAIGATARPAAFLLDNNTIWTVDSTKILSDNGSMITNVSQASYDSHTVGPALRLLH